MPPPPSPDPQNLLPLARAGGAEAFGALTAGLWERLWRSARVMCRDDRQAEDLAQETLVEAWKSLPRFDGRCALSTWMHGILRHRFLKAVRRTHSRPALSFGDTGTEDAVHAGPSPSEHAQRADEAARLRAAVAALPEEQRAVVELRFFAEASLQDIAAALDCPEGTVKSRLHHALLKLRILHAEMNPAPPARESGSNS